MSRIIEISQTHPFSEIKQDHHWQSCGQHYSSFYQPQPATYNQRQQYRQDRRTKPAHSKKYFDRDKVGKHGNINSGIPTPDLKITNYFIGKYFIHKKEKSN